MKQHFILIAICLCAANCGCASYAIKYNPKYSSSWEEFEQFSSQLQSRGDTGVGKLYTPEKVERFKKSYFGIQRNIDFQEMFDRIMRKPATTAGELDNLYRELEENMKFNIEQAWGNEEYREWLAEYCKQLRARINEKAMEILRIEPTVSIAEGTKVRVAIVEIGERIQTIRESERERWRRFFRESGFEAEPVFLPEFVVGERVTADAIRVAAARLGAGAVMAYTTTRETDTGPLGESIAVLAFAKCMMIDTKTEYLYFNAEGEGRDRHVTLPFMVNRTGFEKKVTESAVEGLRAEVLLEIKRLRSED